MLRRLRNAARSALAALCAVFEWIRIRVVDVLARYLAEPLGGSDFVTPAEQGSLAAILDRGDVLLTAGNTRCAALVKRLTRSTWSHVSMYVGPLEQAADPLCIVEADISAGVRPIRLSELKALRVRVLRPAALNETERCLLARSVVRSIGAEYDLAQAWQLGRSLLARGGRAAAKPRAVPAGHSPRRFICSSLVAHAFALLGYSILPSDAALDADAPGSHVSLTPADFERAPVFRVVWPLDAANLRASVS